MQTYSRGVTGDYKLGMNTCMLISALSIFLLALISPWFQWVLASAPFKFLGQISYTLYLIHDLFIEWAQVETKQALMESGVSSNYAILYVFLIYTPIIILFSWLLEWAVDAPSKRFANSVDIESRDDGKKKKDFCEFICGSWQFWCLVGWFSGVFIITEIYQATRTPKDDENPNEFSR